MLLLTHLETALRWGEGIGNFCLCLFPVVTLPMPAGSGKPAFARRNPAATFSAMDGMCLILFSTVGPPLALLII